MSISIEGAAQRFDRPDTYIFISQPQEASHLLSNRSVSRRNWTKVAFVVMSVYMIVFIQNSFSGRITPVEFVGQPQKPARWVIPYETPPDNIQDLPMQESCQEKYLDHTSNNLCTTIEDLCLDTYNCPRGSMVQFNPHATLEGFLFLQGISTIEIVSSETVHLCQREIFENKVEYDISLQKKPVPGETVPCGEEGRIYPISSEGCVIDGNHGVAACKLRKMPIRIVRINCLFFPAIEKVKSYIDGCWRRVTNITICHL